jgi:TATA-box binding protein (TBP) (component of TFIID and TFIIIB)
MKIIETKTTTTMYDTNGKQISVVRKEQTIVEDSQVIRPVNRQEGIKVRNIIADYKNEFQLKKEMVAAMQRHSQIPRSKKPESKVYYGLDFGNMADRGVTTVFESGKPIAIMHITGVPRPGKTNFAMDVLLAAAQRSYESDTQINKSPMKQKRSRRRK